MWVAVATLLGIAVRCVWLDHPRLWMDELTSVLYTRESWSSLLGPMGRVDVHPPLYYLLQKAWLIFGDSPLAMRSLPALLGSACIPLLYLIGRRVIGVRVGIVAALLMTTAPLHVEQARQLRMYSLLTLAALIAIAGLVHAMSAWDRDQQLGSMRRRGAAWIVYAAGSILAFYAHSTAVLLPLVVMLVVTGMRLSGFATPSDFRGCVWASAVIALGVAPWMFVLHGHVMDTLSEFWIPAPTLGYVLGRFSGLLPYPRPVKVLFMLLCLSGVWALRRRPSSLWTIGGISAGQPLAMWALSYVRPILLIRAMVWPTALLLLLPAAALARFQRGIWVAGAVGIFVLVQAMALQPHYPREIQKTEYADICGPLRDFNPSTDRLVLAFQMLENGIRFEAPKPFDESTVIALNYGDRRELLRDLFRSKHVMRVQLAESVRGAGRVWFLTEISPKFPIANDADVRPSIEAVAGLGRRIGYWESGNLALTLIDMSVTSASTFDSVMPVP